MDERPDDDLIRELYARFGLAYYESECLHRGLCTLLALSELPSRELITRPRVEERLARAFSMTLGDVARGLEGVLPDDLSDELRQAVDARNFLAHHFWFERANLMFAVASVNQLIAELMEYAELFDRLDKWVSQWAEPKNRALGLTDEVLADSVGRILAGEVKERLPDKQTVRELEKKLTRRQRLAHVWEFALDDGSMPLIFELADGSLWQLSDVGLGWTRFQEVESHWTEHPAVAAHLPAEILPRPGTNGQWDYEFQLANGAALWVKPGRKKLTFRWGVRTAA